MDIYGFDAPHLPIALLTAIATSEPRLWMYGSDVTHGILRFLHLIGAAGFVGTVIPLNLAQLGWLKLGEARPLRLVLEVSFWLAVVTGVALFVMDPIATGLHTMFLPKLVLVVLGYLAAKWPRGAGARPFRRPVFAASSLAVWLLVMGCSTWNRIEHPRVPASVLNLEEGREG